MRGILLVGMALLAGSQATGPIGYWRLDDTASPAEDAVGVADGTWIGPVQASTDVPPKITFDNCGSMRFRPVATAGGINCVTLGRTTALDTVQNGSFTLSAWVKPASLPTGAGPDAQYGILLKGGQHEGLSLAGGGFVMGHWTDATPSGYVAAGYGGNYVSANSNWYHVAGVVDKTALKVRIYVDGVAPLNNSEAALPAGVNGWPIYNNEAWNVGVHIPDAANGVRYQADAWIDDVRIYDRALTPTEIQTLANGGTVGDPPITPPATPIGLAATAGTNQVSLVWQAVPGASGYNVKRSTTTGTETQHAVAATNSYVDTGLTAGTKYYYVVSALVRCSEGANSLEVSATPTAPVVTPPAPSGPKEKEHQPCGCGLAESTGAGVAFVVALLVAYGMVLRSQART